MQDIPKEDLRKLTENLLAERAVDFRDYKPTTLSRRIQRRLDATDCPDIACYLQYLDKRPDEYSKLIDSILINVTEFFRDSEAWEIIRNEVIPRIISDKRPGDQIRIWSAGCASGEEAYTVAMILSDLLGDRAAEYDVRVYATDIDEDSLSTARRGEYPDDSIKTVPETCLNAYFDKNARWTAKRDLRKMLIFGRHNLVTDAPISRADMVICRNVLIYMSVELQNRILSKFHYALQPRGFLFLGRAESLLTASKLFNTVNDKWRIFSKESPLAATTRGFIEQQAVSKAVETGSAEYQLASLFNEAALRHASSGVIGIDHNGVVRIINPAAETVWGTQASELLGKTIGDAKLPPGLQSILPRIAQAQNQRSAQRIEQMDLSQEHDRPFHITLVISPLSDVMGSALGLVVVAENITNQVRLREELEAADEQLRAANEELETTNEELQSTNEELETTNEELQSTNEELETTNEELQSTNEELTTTNDELGVRTDDLSILSLYYNSVVESLAVPIVVLNGKHEVTTWNPAAEQFYGMKASDAMGQDFFGLSLPVRVARTRERLRSLKETRKAYRSQPMEYKTQTGDTRRVIIEYQPLIDAQGNYKGAISIVRDADLKPLEPAAR